MNEITTRVSSLSVGESWWVIFHPVKWCEIHSDFMTCHLILVILVILVIRSSAILSTVSLPCAAAVAALAWDKWICSDTPRHGLSSEKEKGDIKDTKKIPTKSFEFVLFFWGVFLKISLVCRCQPLQWFWIFHLHKVLHVNLCKKVQFPSVKDDHQFQWFVWFRHPHPTSVLSFSSGKCWCSYISKQESSPILWGNVCEWEKESPNIWRIVRDGGELQFT